MSKPVKGIRIGNYRITPLGIVTLVVLLALIGGGVFLAVARPFGGEDVPVGAQLASGALPTLAPAGDAPEDDALASLEPTREPTPTPTPRPTPEPEPRSATIRSIGEIAMQQNLLYSVVSNNEYDFSEMFTHVSEVMGNADYTVADVEGTLGGTAAASGSAAMITPPSLIGNLQDCGVDMLFLANDHALDGGYEELQATIRNCADAGMEYVGAAASAEEKAAPKIIDINGINVAFLGYTSTLNGNEKKTSSDAVRFGVNLISAGANAANDVKAARDAGADVVVCYVSWGEMLNRSVTDSQKKIAQALVKAGVDVIVGYNPHVIQPVMWLENNVNGEVHRTLLIGATGNFLSDQRDKYTDNGLIFEFTIQETGSATGQFAITSPRYIPTYVWRADGEDGKYVYRTMAIGQWLDQQPEGMSYTDLTYMREIWAEDQQIIDSEVAAITAE